MKSWLLSLVLVLSHLVELSAATPATADKPAALPAEILHVPQEPRTGQSVSIQVKPHRDFASATLEYQVVDPGAYIALKDPAYKTRWVSQPMRAESAAGRQSFSAEVPDNVQTHRRLVRYRVKLLDAAGQTTLFPAADDPEPNFAYFVYDGIPPWKGAIQPGAFSPGRSEMVAFGTNTMAQVQSNFLIGKARDVENATWYEKSYDKEFKYTGTYVADGVVYDHVQFRARGGVWRHSMGKNMWKFEFNKNHRLRARDDYGRPYRAKWSKLNLRSCIQQGDYGRRGEQGMYEAVGFRLFNLAGVAAPRTHWISLRIVDEKVETPADQYKGDFWGLYLAIENEDGRFLEEHDLAEGVIYKMMGGQGEPSNQPKDDLASLTAIRKFLNDYRRNGQNTNWWKTNFNLPNYYSYRAIVEGIHHYDIADGKNYDFYHDLKSGRWQVVPWDIDLTWGDHMYGGGVGDYERLILSRPAFRIELQNRFREIHDLLFNPDEAGRLIDECAAVIGPTRDGPGIVAADRAKWDYHPIMASQHVDSGKAGQGLFYQAVRGKDFPGMVQQMKDYVAQRAQRLEVNDPTVPPTPKIAYAGPAGHPAGKLEFNTTAIASGATIAAMQWRLGEVANYKPRSGATPGELGKYEITPVWQSGELTTLQESIKVPAGAVKPGHTYRARVRVMDPTGRWSHWSAPIQFTAGE